MNTYLYYYLFPKWELLKEFVIFSLDNMYDRNRLDEIMIF